MPNPPRLVILAGPNGAGKSTLAPVVLDRYGIVEFVNADTIARGLSAFDPESAAFEAGRVMLKRLRELAGRRADLAFETTLASRTFAPWIASLVRDGYEAHLYYVWLPDPAMCVARVASRVRSGGHHVPEEDIRRRYGRGMKNFWELYRPLATSWAVYENREGRRPVILARGRTITGVEVEEPERWRLFVRNLGR